DLGHLLGVVVVRGERDHIELQRPGVLFEVLLVLLIALLLERRQEERDAFAGARRRLAASRGDQDEEESRERADHEERFLFERTSTLAAARRMRPLRISCQLESTRRRFMPLDRVPKTRAPSREPTIEPRPPARLVPP